MKPDNTIKCNSAQRRAIEHDKGPACVIAGPGSGKTFVIIQRIINLIRKGVRPGSILTITFTKAAAIEMQQRFIKDTDSMYPEVLFGTFHSIFYHILDNGKLSIIKETDKYKILSHILHGRDYDNEMIRLILYEISRIKNSGVSPEERDKATPFYEEFPRIYDEYASILTEQKLIDFDDMVLCCRKYLIERPDVRKKWQDRFEYIQIDEYQDINRMQFEVIKLLLNKEQNIFVVGDDDQSIYGFRGSDPGIMLGFKESFSDSEEILLDTNYRCARHILKSAMNVIEENTIRFKKNIIAGKSEPAGIIKGYSFTDRKEQYEYLLNSLKGRNDLSDIAVILRTNVEATAVARTLTEANIPCSYKERVVALHEKQGVRDIVSYMAFACDGAKRTDFLRIMNKPLRYISRKCCISEKVLENEVLMYYAREGKLSMTSTVQKLFRDIRMLSKLGPKASVHFIRGYMGYDKFLKEKYIANPNIYNEQISDLNDFEKLCENFRSFNELKEYLSDLQKQLDSLKRIDIKNKNGVKVMTMHASKGLEFKAVFLPDLNEGIVPSRKSITIKELEEERRMLYVAMTRAKEELYMSYVKGTRENPMRMSGFLRPVRSIFDKND